MARPRNDPEAVRKYWEAARVGKRTHRPAVVVVVILLGLAALIAGLWLLIDKHSASVRAQVVEAHTPEPSKDHQQAAPKIDYEELEQRANDQRIAHLEALEKLNQTPWLIMRARRDTKEIYRVRCIVKLTSDAPSDSYARRGGRYFLSLANGQGELEGCGVITIKSEMGERTEAVLGDGKPHMAMLEVRLYDPPNVFEVQKIIAFDTWENSADQ